MRPILLRLLFLGLLGLLAACGGGGSASDSEFRLVGISVQEGQLWQINRPIRLEFSADVDFDSVNLNSIHVMREGGVPATGEFTLEGPRTVRFQPACPRLSDYSDAGFLPGGYRYRIDLPAAGGSGGSGGASVRSAQGVPLAVGYGVTFWTPTSTDPAVLFLDAGSGPPVPVIASESDTLDATYLEIGEDPANRVYLQPRADPDAELGADVPVGFVAGLNLYSDTATHVAISIAIDQPVNPSEANVNDRTVLLQYREASGSWRALAHTVELSANCTGTGARVRVAPIGLLPQNRLVRVVLTQDFVDLVGQGSLVPLVVGSFLVSVAVDPDGTSPIDGVDVVHDEFDRSGDEPGSFEDAESPLADPRADWGLDGTLRAGFSFDGTGGTDGTFDWQVGHDPPGSAQTIVLDTSFSVITNAEQSAQQFVVGGVVDIRNLIVKANGTVLVQGPNACRILVSGSARIDGTIFVKGGSNLGVTTLGTANIPEPGAPGQGGGGRGGTGSYLTTQSTPVGQDGYGAFNAEHGGGQGGETGYNPNIEPEGWRRAGGGGGGTFGRDVARPAGIAPGYSNPDGCPDQGRVGLDAEPGFRGDPHAGGALHPGQQPLGGDVGPRPFVDADPVNDFWGTMRMQSGSIVRGELSDRWAGAGGGAGGNCLTASAFPGPYFDYFSDEKGAGGGGGGGSITILALGDIVLGPSGRIDASGGTGGGGEDQFPTKRIGGGSGGGSGGHIVLQSASSIDLSECSSASVPPGGLYALGGQGGEGADARGGARFGTPTSLSGDALPVGAYPSSSAPCRVVSGQAGYDYTNAVGDGNPTIGVVCCGGDGGPGIVQLHTPTLAEIVVSSGAGRSVYEICKPPPYGSTPAVGVPTLARIDSPAEWDQLLPIFGRKSQALSKWILLGGASVDADPTSDVPGPVSFSFGGTDAAGRILTSGGSGATVLEVPAVLTGVIALFPSTPYLAADGRTVVFDGTTIADDLYLRNTALLKRSRLEISFGGTVGYEVAAAVYDPATHELRLTVEPGGLPLSSFDLGDVVRVHPRFFAVITDGVPNALPDSSRIVVEFQAALATNLGEPDVGSESEWVSDIRRIDPNVAPNLDYRYFRFRVSFDVSADGAPLSFDTPIPSLDFFRVPFRF